jgi:hypothetical protein
MTLLAVGPLWRSSCFRGNIVTVTATTECVLQTGKGIRRSGEHAMGLLLHVAVAEDTIKASSNMPGVGEVDLLRHRPDLCSMTAEALLGGCFSHRLGNPLMAEVTVINRKLQGSVILHATMAERTTQASGHRMRHVGELLTKSHPREVFHPKMARKAFGLIRRFYPGSRRAFLLANGSEGGNDILIRFFQQSHSIGRIMDSLAPVHQSKIPPRLSEEFLPGPFSSCLHPYFDLTQLLPHSLYSFCQSYSPVSIDDEIFGPMTGHTAHLVSPEVLTCGKAVTCLTAYTCQIHGRRLRFDPLAADATVEIAHRRMASGSAVAALASSSQHRFPCGNLMDNLNVTVKAFYLMLGYVRPMQERCLSVSAQTHRIIVTSVASLPGNLPISLYHFLMAGGAVHAKALYLPMVKREARRRDYLFRNLMAQGAAARALVERSILKVAEEASAGSDRDVTSLHDLGVATGAAQLLSPAHLGQMGLVVKQDTAIGLLAE